MPCWSITCKSYHEAHAFVNELMTHSLYPEWVVSLFTNACTLVITHAGYRSAWHGSYDHSLPVPGFWNITLSMRIYDILLEHIDKSINCSRNSLAPSPLLKGLWRQEAEFRIDYLCDDHWDNIFSWIKLLNYLRATECKCPLLPSFCIVCPRR